MPYSHGGVEEIRSYTLRYKDALDPILHVLEDEALTGMLNLYPEKHYIRRPGPKGDNMRVWSDSHTGDDWHDMQVSLDYFITYIPHADPYLGKDWRG